MSRNLEPVSCMFNRQSFSNLICKLLARTGMGPKNWQKAVLTKLTFPGTRGAKAVQQVRVKAKLREVLTLRIILCEKMLRAHVALNFGDGFSICFTIFLTLARQPHSSQSLDDSSTENLQFFFLPGLHIHQQGNNNLQNK